MNKPKYIRKEMIQINENLRVYQYFYTWGVTVYFSPKNEAEEVVKVDVAYPTAMELALMQKLKAKESA